jgi:hypothetical protein
MTEEEIDFGGEDYSDNSNNKYSSSNKLYTQFRVKNGFARYLIERYIGNDFFICRQETKKVLLDMAYQKYLLDIPKDKQKKWVRGNYKISEMINGRKARCGGIRNQENKYPCDFCSKKYRLRFELNKHIKKSHPEKNISALDLTIINLRTQNRTLRIKIEDLKKENRFFIKKTISMLKLMSFRLSFLENLKSKLNSQQIIQSAMKNPSADTQIPTEKKNENRNW